MVKLENCISIPNGYQLRVKQESISHVGRSIYREIDSNQVVFEIVDDRGKVTKRLGIPACILPEVKEVLAR
jgi:hypothetical protein